MNRNFRQMVMDMIQNTMSYNAPTISFRIWEKDDPYLLDAKDVVKDWNDSQARLCKKYGINPKFVRISLMGRGPRRDKSKPYVGPYGRTRHPKWHSNADCNLQHKYAEKFEVYIHMDGDRAYRMRGKYV